VRQPFTKFSLACQWHALVQFFLVVSNVTFAVCEAYKHNDELSTVNHAAVNDVAGHEHQASPGGELSKAC